MIKPNKEKHKYKLEDLTYYNKNNYYFRNPNTHLIKPNVLKIVQYTLQRVVDYFSDDLSAL